ncbi:hypothetical protein [Coleofasciculus sp. FACHB-1120]|uniref:hypothetical protein n=1 Tax=Coleofasciculus sp. FACHB-1120 TaxID=2692783 RepID=UPI0016832F37|nr:hypothetical protein [Coleofasciculus sp. FACHB-1120]MBD2742692.1 hypothetical protein [Coleofasciculus sp. FACHB-1120]
MIAIASSVTNTTKVAIAILTGSASNAAEFTQFSSLALLTPELGSFCHPSVKERFNEVNPRSLPPASST